MRFGVFYDFPARNVVPKRVQKPHPPLWVACTNVKTIAQAAEWGLGALGFSFVGASHFAVNVLTSGQITIANRFARSGGDKFAEVAWRPGCGGAPVLANVAASFECPREAKHEAGDHVILIGRVERFARFNHPALLLAQGRVLAHLEQNPDASIGHIARECFPGPLDAEEAAAALIARGDAVRGANSLLNISPQGRERSNALRARCRLRKRAAPNSRSGRCRRDPARAAVLGACRGRSGWLMASKCNNREARGTATQVACDHQLIHH